MSESDGMSRIVFRSATFEIVDSGRDEYPGDGLRLHLDKFSFQTDLLYALGFQRDDIRRGDEFEITARLVSRTVTMKVKV